MNNYDYASRTKRFLNWIIDGLIITVLWIVLFISISTLTLKLGLLNGLEDGKKYDLGFTILSVMFLYYMILEGIFKTTLGKLITRTKLIRLNGGKIRFYDALIRTICRLIPFEQLSFLSEKPVGWHDSISNTRLLNINGK